MRTFTVGAEQSDLGIDCKTLFCFDLGFHISNPVIEYRLDPSCMSYMEARAEMPWENNSQFPFPRAQRVANCVHLQLASPTEELEPAQDTVEQQRRLNRLSQPGISSAEHIIDISIT